MESILILPLLCLQIKKWPCKMAIRNQSETNKIKKKICRHLYKCKDNSLMENAKNLSTIK